MTGWIKIYRKLMQWEHYDNSYMVHLLIHVVLSANLKDKRWRGQLIRRGQLVTGRKSLSSATGISEQTVRTCLQKMVHSKELTIQSTSKYSIITIRKYEDYQPDATSTSTSTSTNKAPEANQQLTTTKEGKNSSTSKEIRTPLQIYIEENYSNVSKLRDQLTKDESVKLTRLYPSALVKLKLDAMENKKSLVKDYVSVYLTLSNWCRMQIDRNGGVTDKHRYEVGNNKYTTTWSKKSRRK